MKPSLQRLILLLTIFVLCIPIVSAVTTCTVLNVTTGPAGPAGANGTSCTTGVNYTFTLAAGNPATVTNVGTGIAALLDFGIPIGPQGVNGTPGATGSTGPAGPPGANGADGAPGPNNDPWYLWINGTRAMTGNLNLGSNKITSLITGLTGDSATNKTYVDAAVAGVTGGDTTQFLFLNGTRAMTGNLSMGSKYINSLITGGLGSDAVNKTYVDAANTSLKNYVCATFWSGTNYNASYWTGSNYNASYWTGTNYNSSYLTSTYNASYLNKDGSVAMTGNLNLSSNKIISLITGTTGDTATNKTYVDTKANLTQYSYVTLMAGSAMFPTTNPPSDFNQWETTTNKNNYIYANFTAGSSNNTQWIVDMPSDWNSGNIVGSFLWTAASGTGTVNWTLSGYRFADNVNIDTALPLIGNATDTLQTVGYMHVSPDTGSAAVTGTGNTIIFKVGRSTDTLTYQAQLIGVRIKYIKAIGAV